MTEINWPVEFGKELLVGNPNKPVGVCTLWSDREHVGGQLGVENIAVIGNLYSHGPGIEGIIRNVPANPSISAVVITGKDKSQSAETLLRLSRAGVERTRYGWTVPLADNISDSDLPPGKRTIDEVIPLEAIDLFRREVEIIDMRGKSWQEVSDFVKKKEESLPFAEPAVFPKSKAKIEVMHGENIGFLVRGSRPDEVWLEILRTIRSFGYIGESQWTNKSQEVLNFIAVLDGDLEEMMHWPASIGNSPQAVTEYAQQLIKGQALGPEDSYAYGERMRVRRGDQIGFLIGQLKKNPNSRSMVIDLWDVEKDWFGRPESPPCLTQAWFRMFKDKLCTTFIYRSHDMYGAWIKNAMGDRILQAYIAQEAGLPLGTTTIISESAHIYEHDFTQIDQLLAEHKLRWQFVEDPRGNIIIGTDGDEIVLRHENSSGAVTELRGGSAEKLYKELWRQKLVSMVDHALYVGSELRRAQECLKRGEIYEQDRA